MYLHNTLMTSICHLTESVSMGTGPIASMRLSIHCSQTRNFYKTIQIWNTDSKKCNACQHL